MKQLEILARQLLAQRSGLEAIVLQAADRPAIAATAHGLIDQLDAAFAIVGAMQAMGELDRAGETIETAPDAGATVEKPPVFGAKRKAAALAAGVSPTTEADHGKQQEQHGPPCAGADVPREQDDDRAGVDGPGVGPSDR